MTQQLRQSVHGPAQDGGQQHAEESDDEDEDRSRLDRSQDPTGRGTRSCHRECIQTWGLGVAVWSHPRGYAITAGTEKSNLTTNSITLSQTEAKRRRFRRGRRSTTVAVALAAAVIVAAGVYVLHGAGGYYAISPGTAPTVSASPDCKSVGGGNWALPGGRPCVRIVIPASKSAPVDGSIMMVDVLEGPATPWEFALAKLGLLHSLDDSTVLYPNQAILGGSPASQLGCQQTQQMQGAQSAASVVALRALGYKVAEKDLGAQVVEVVPGTPAAAAGVQCNDVITEVDGRPTPTSGALAAAIAALTPGSPATVTVSRTASNGSTRVVALHAKLTSVPREGSTAPDPHKAFLGVATQTDASFSYPFPVSIDVGAIGGPSAGLALTLGLLDSLTHGQLTGGRRIAATGTISLNGAVGDVGGVPQKTVAVRKAGAQYFFVPVQELAAARSEADGMKVYAVSSLAQALRDLEALGGSIPKSVLAKA